jgi:hypothetical protein
MIADIRSADLSDVAFLFHLPPSTPPCGTCVVLRDDDPICRRAERICEALLDYVKQQQEGSRHGPSNGLRGTPLGRVEDPTLKADMFRWVEVS